MPDPIVYLNEESLRADLGELVRRTVEDTLNGLLEEEAGDLVGAERYERTADREAYRAVNLNLPRFRLHPYSTFSAASSMFLNLNSAGQRFPSSALISIQF